MTCALFVHCSPHGPEARGYQLACEILERAQRSNDKAALIERDLTATPLPPLDADYATALTSNIDGNDHNLDLSGHLISELERSDRLLIALPMHNFTVPAAFKLWIDYVVRIHRSFERTADGKVGLLADRPTTILVSSGGFHQGADASQPDFLTSYVTHVFAMIGIHDVAFHYLQGLTCGESAVVSALETARERLSATGLLDLPSATAVHRGNRL